MRMLAVAVLAVALAGACAPPPASFFSWTAAGTRVVGDGRQVCAPREPRNAAELDAVFSTRGPWWAGADGGLLVELPQGQRLWLFGDTFVTRVDPRTRRAMPGWTMVNNSALRQRGACFDVLMGGSPAGPSASWLTPPEPGRLWWPVSGYYDTAAHEVVLFALRQVYGTFAFDGMDELRLSWPDLVLRRSSRLPFDTAAGTPAFATTLLVDGGHLYGYGAGHVNRSSFVARTAWPRTEGSAWEVWDGTGWNADVAAGAPMTFGGIASRSAMHVTVRGARYVAVAQAWDGITRDVGQWSADAPQGPWRYDGTIVATVTDPESVSYGARLVELTDGPAVTYSVNRRNWAHILDDTSRYGVRAQAWRTPVLPSAVPGTAWLPAGRDAEVPLSAQTLVSGAAAPR